MSCDRLVNVDQHEPRSYWQATAAPSTLASELPSYADVAIIGGGIIGTAATYWMARAGIAAVLLEGTSLAYGATGRNGGFVTVGPAESLSGAMARLGEQAARDILHLTLRNQVLLQEVLDEEGIDAEYQVRDRLSLALDEQHLAHLAHDAEVLQANGVAASILDWKQLQDFIRTPLGPEIVGGKYMSQQGVIHPVKLVQGLAAAALRRGAHLCHAKVISLSPDGDAVMLHTTQGLLHAGKVIVAVNAWAGDLLPGLAHLITPVRGQMLAFAPTVPIFTVGMGASVTPTGEYWQQRADSTILLYQSAS